MRHFRLCFLSVFLLAGCGRVQPRIAGMLYVIQKDGLYGLCDAGKQLVVAPQYAGLSWAPPYFVARKSRQQILLLDAQGRRLDSGSQVLYLADSALVLLRGQAFRPDAAGFPGPQAVFFRDGRRDTLPGSVVAALPGSDRRLNCLVIDSAGMQGLLQLVPRRVLVPLRFRSLRLSQDGFLQGSGTDGGVHWFHPDGSPLAAVPGLRGARPMAGGRLFAVDSGTPGGRNYDDVVKFYDPAGRLLRTHQGNYAAMSPLPETLMSGFSPLFIQLTHGAPSDDGTSYSVMDSGGSLVLDHVHRISPPYGRLLVTSHRLPKEPDRYQDYREDGIYDLARRRYIVRADAATSIHQGDQILFTDRAGFRTVYDGNGEVAARFPIRGRDAIEATYERIRRQTGISLRGTLFSAGMNDVLFTRSTWAYRAFRSDSAGLFVVYSQDMTRRHPLLLEDFAQGSDMWEFMGRERSGWGAWIAAPREESRDDIARANGAIRQKIPPRYDSLARSGFLYRAVAGGRIQWLDSGGRLLAKGKSFPHLEGPAVAGSVLAFDDAAGKVSVVDSNGDILGTLPAPEIRTSEARWMYSYDLLPGGEVLCLTRTGASIGNPGTGKVLRLEQELSHETLMYSLRGPLAASFTDAAGGSGEGVYSLVNRRVLIPTGRYYSFDALPYGPTAVAIYGRDPYGLNLLLGILEADGTFYSGADVR